MAPSILDGVGRYVDCLDEQALLDFLAGRLDGPSTTRARAHVVRCEVCHAIATDMIRHAASHVRAAPARVKGYELVPGSIVGQRYRLVRPLGEGGMGVVWAAEGPGGERVAVKLLKAFDEPAKKRFRREIVLVSALSHPGIVRVIEVLDDVEAGAPALVMEHLAGESLAEHMQRASPMPPTAAIAIARDLARVLAVVHDAAIVHRDLKPSNVLLAVSPTRPVVLLDLGLAKSLAGDGDITTRLTRTGHALGTLAYMAPEQLAGERGIDRRADLWSLGVILYECLLGSRPYAGTTVAEALRAIMKGPRPDTARLAPAVRPVAEALLAVPVADRPASARDVGDALDRALAHALGGG